MEKDKNSNQDTLNEDLEQEYNDQQSPEINRLQEIEIELQEIEIALDKLEDKIVRDNQEQYIDEYNQLKEKFNELLAERKSLKPKKNSAWDQIKTWMIIYAIIQFILSMPFAAQYTWMYVADLMIALTKIYELKETSEAIFNISMILLIYMIPIFNLLLSWFIYVNFVKEDFDKKVFRYIWIVQALLILALGIWLFIQVINPILL